MFAVDPSQGACGPRIRFVSGGGDDDVDRAEFDPRRSWDLVSALVAAGRERDAAAYADAADAFARAPASLCRNGQRVGIALVVLTLVEVLGDRATRADVARLASRIEPEARRFMRANRWDIEDVLAPLLDPAAPIVDAGRVALLGGGVVGLLVDAMPPVDEVARTADQYLEAARGPALRMAAGLLAPAAAESPAESPAELPAQPPGPSPRVHPLDDVPPVLP